MSGDAASPGGGAAGAGSGAPRLQRALTLRDLIVYGIVLIEPTAPMGIYGVVSVEARATSSPRS
jgi:hypothetical protein